MKKSYLIIAGIALLILLAGGGLFLYQSTSQSDSAPTASVSESGSPERPAEVTGYIVSSLGNDITVAKEIGKEVLTDEEQEARKAEMQAMSPEERQAARQAETATLETEDVDLNIPVGVPIVKGSGDASGNVVTADIAELTKGVYVSVWIDQSGNVEYVKIKGL